VGAVFLIAFYLFAVVLDLIAVTFCLNILQKFFTCWCLFVFTELYQFICSYLSLIVVADVTIYYFNVYFDMFVGSQW